MSLLSPSTPPSTAAPAAPAAPAARGFWPMRDIPTAFWFIATLTAIIAATIAPERLPMARWLTIHLLLLGGVTHAILVWSQYFSYALLRSRATHGERRAQNLRLILANAGAAVVFVGVPSDLWPVTLVGAMLIAVAVAWHGFSLYRRARTSMPGRFGRTTHYYIVSSVLLLVGITFGVLVAGGVGGAGAHLVLAHSLVNMLGWVGLTVAGTVVTLWPTILRTRIDERASRGSVRALPLLAVGVIVAAVGASIAVLPLIALGLALYLAGLSLISVSLWREARQTAPYSFAALSMGLALTWWIGAVALLLVGTVWAVFDSDGSGFATVSVLMRSVAPFLVVGFAAQIVLGALSYLVPVVIGGGPTPVRTGATAFDRFGPFRVAVTNVALGMLALPLTGFPRTAATALVVLALTSFLPIMMLAMRAQSAAKRAVDPVAAAARSAQVSKRRGPIVPEGEQPDGRRAGQAVAGLLVVVLTVALGFAITGP